MSHGHELSALSLAQHVVRLQTLLDKRIVTVLNSHGLSRSELDVMGALVESDPAGARPRELSSRLLLTTGGLSNILRRLQGDGLIEREADDADARSRIIRLTPEGKTTAQRAGSDASEAISHLLDRVDTALLNDTTQLLHRVLSDIEKDSPVHRKKRVTSV